MRDILAPVKRPGSQCPVFRDPDEPAVGNQHIGTLHRSNHFRGCPVVREIVAGEPEMVVHVLSLSPDQPWLLRESRVGLGEIEPLLRRAGVLHGQRQGIVPGPGTTEVDEQRLRMERERKRLPPVCHPADLHFLGIELNIPQLRKKGNERHNDKSDERYEGYFPL